MESKNEAYQIERQGRITDQILAERVRQDNLWGNVPSRLHLTDDKFLAILGEEVGECCHAASHEDENNLIKELIQVAAVAMAHIEVIEERRNLGVMLIPKETEERFFRVTTRLGQVYGDVCREKLDESND